MKTEELLQKIEARFLQITNLDVDLSQFPLSNAANSQVETNKDKSKQFSEVFTPLWLVDEMLSQTELHPYNVHPCKTLDLCAGFGQFSMRLMRYYFNTFEGFRVKTFLKNHSFSELQLSSCYKLILLFGNKINLFIGDSSNLGKLPESAEGIWVYIGSAGKWVCLTKTVLELIYCGKRKPVSEELFVQQMEMLISHFERRFTTMKDITLEQVMCDKKNRYKVIALLNEDTKAAKGIEGSLQGVDTPEEILEQLVARVDVCEKKAIAVLFNVELIEYLVSEKGVDPSRITYLADIGSEIEASFVKAWYGIDCILSQDKNATEWNREELKAKKFDVVFSNPPYNRGMDLKILSALLGENNSESIAKEFVIVHPSTWLLDLKGKTPAYGSIKNRIEGSLKSVKLFNGNAVFNIDLFLPCVITHIDLSLKSSSISVDYFGNTYCCEKLNEVTKFGKDWKLVKPFFKIMKTKESVWSHNVKKLTYGKHYCQLAAIMGNHGKDKSRLVKDDFYTLTIRGSEENKGIRQPNLDRPGNPTPTFEFDTEKERDNFLSYLNTDFARFCLALLKNNNNTSVGEMELIPWLDFTEEWNDEKLFKHFDVNKDLQDYIRSFLPDYYGIRK